MGDLCGRLLFFLCSMAFFIFFAAATGTGVVAANPGSWRGATILRGCLTASVTITARGAALTSRGVPTRRQGFRTGIAVVAFGLAADTGKFIGIGADFAWRFTWRLRLLDGNRNFTMQQFE